MIMITRHKVRAFVVLKLFLFYFLPMFIVLTFAAAAARALNNYLRTLCYVKLICSFRKLWIIIIIIAPLGFDFRSAGY